MSPSRSPASIHRQPPSISQSPAARPTTTGRSRTSKASLHLSTLPRFHPATFQLREPGSAYSSGTTPTATANSPHAPSPPRSPRLPYPPAQPQARPMSSPSQFHSNHRSRLHHQQQHYQQQDQQQQLEAQRQPHLYQRELLAVAGRAAQRSPRQRPASPQLIPLCSPGPVTPLMLEDDQQQQQQNGYLVARTTSDPAPT